jgi:hypothetical protein
LRKNQYKWIRAPSEEEPLVPVPESVIGLLRSTE